MGGTDRHCEVAETSLNDLFPCRKHEDFNFHRKILELFIISRLCRIESLSAVTVLSHDLAVPFRNTQNL